MRTMSRYGFIYAYIYKEKKEKCSSTAVKCLSAVVKCLSVAEKCSLIIEKWSVWTGINISQ